MFAVLEQPKPRGSEGRDNEGTFCVLGAKNLSKRDDSQNGSPALHQFGLFLRDG